MAEHTATATSRPVPKPLTPSASGYLGELSAAADLVQHRLKEAEIAERTSWLIKPRQYTEATRGADSALNSPAIHVDGWRMSRQFDEVSAARLDVGRVAWWYASAALAALDAVLAGKQISARRLEVLTLQAPGRDKAVKGQTSPWAPCYRPHLPGDGELLTGVQHLDESMAKALDPLKAAYAAALLAEDIYARENEVEDDDGPEGMADWEAAQLHDAEQLASTIPDLLIAYAREVSAAAHRAPRA